MDNKMKIKIGAMVIVLLVVLYMVIGMFSAPAEEVAPAMKPNPDIPKQGEIMAKPPKPAQQSAASTEAVDAKFLAMQQEAQTKYMTALNELQMLRINKDIAETNKAIMKAKEDTVKSQSNIVNLLTPAAPPPAPVKVEAAPPNPAASDPSLRGMMPPTPPKSPIRNDELSVVSVTNIRGHWTAVINSGKSLYKVGVGDVIPEEESTVVTIDRTGVTVEKDGSKHKIYMTSVI